MKLHNPSYPIISYFHLQGRVGFTDGRTLRLIFFLLQEKVLKKYTDIDLEFHPDWFGPFSYRVRDELAFLHSVRFLKGGEDTGKPRKITIKGSRFFMEKIRPDPRAERILKEIDAFKAEYHHQTFVQLHHHIKSTYPIYHIEGR